MHEARTRVTMLSTNVAKRNGVAKDALASASTHFSTHSTERTAERALLAGHGSGRWQRPAGHHCTPALRPAPPAGTLRDPRASRGLA